MTTRSPCALEIIKAKPSHKNLSSGFITGPKCAEGDVPCLKKRKKKHLRIGKGAIELEFLLFLFLFSVFVFFKESCDNWVFSLA